MSTPSRVLIVADFNAGSRSHRATTDAIGFSSAALGLPIDAQWLDTPEAGSNAGVKALAGASGIWIGPGSPYRSMDGALGAIRLARERRIPILGTCGGFQHIIIEHARNVLGIDDAEHEESAPGAKRHVISRLACSLAGRTMTLSLAKGSRLASIYGCEQVTEEYLCNFGVNPAYEEVLQRGELRIAASDAEGKIRAVEIPQHPFFVGTLFLPQHRATAGSPHPLVTAFLRAALSDL